jgi:hypothetical protein
MVLPVWHCSSAGSAIREVPMCHGGVWSDYGLRRQGIRAEGQSFESCLTYAMLAMDLDDGLQF